MSSEFESGADRGRTPVVATVRSAADAMAAGEAVEVAYKRLREDLIGFAEGRFGFGRHEAEDVVQDAFIRVALAAGRDPGSMCEKIGIDAYLYVVVRNVCVDRFRSARRRSEVVLDDEALGRLVVDGARARQSQYTGPLAEVCAAVARAREVLTERVADGRTSRGRAHGVEQALVAFIVHRMTGLRLVPMGGVYEVYALLTDGPKLSRLGAETLEIHGVTPETLNQNVFRRRRDELEEIIIEAFRGDDDAGALVAA